MTNAISRSVDRCNARANSAIAFYQQTKMASPFGMGSGPVSDNANGVSGWKEQTAARQRYARYHGWVYAAVHALAQQAGQQAANVGRQAPTPKKRPGNRKGGNLALPTWLSSKMAEGELEVLVGDELNTLLDHPNSMQYRFQFVYSFVANLCLSGWAFMVCGEDEETGEFRLYSLPTTWVTPVHKKYPFSHFRIVDPKNPTAAYEDRDLLTDVQVCWVNLPNPADPMGGLAPAGAQSRAIAIDDNIQNSQTIFFDNAVFPSAIVTIGKDPHPDVPGTGMRPRLTAPQRRQVIGAIKRVMSGVANYGNPAIIDGMIESIERLTSTQNEIGWEKSEETVKKRILSAFGVHPFILGEQMPGSYAQAYIVRSLFYDRVNLFLSLLGLTLTDFNKRTRPDQADKVIWFEEAKAKDPTIEKGIWEAARGRDDVTQNEFRAWLGLPPDEDKNESVLPKSVLTAVITLCEKVRGGKIDPEQGVAVMEALGVPSDAAAKIIGEGQTEEELAAATAALNQASQNLGQAQQQGKPEKVDEEAGKLAGEQGGETKPTSEGQAGPGPRGREASR